jgi:hypothetical protein
MNYEEDIRTFYDTAFCAGLPVISGDECCRLLAWLYVYGGGREECVLNANLREPIFYAQKRLNIFGGEHPDAELLPIFQQYIRSISDFRAPPDWVVELEKKYKIKPLGNRR